jgi:hypothetical protein
VLLGFALTLLKLAFKAARLKINLIALAKRGHGAAPERGGDLLKVPALTQVLDTVPAGPRCMCRWAT